MRELSVSMQPLFPRSMHVETGSRCRQNKQKKHECIARTVPLNMYLQSQSNPDVNGIDNAFTTHHSNPVPTLTLETETVDTVSIASKAALISSSEASKARSCEKPPL